MQPLLAPKTSTSFLVWSAPRPLATSRRLITRCVVVLLSLFHFLQLVCEFYCFCFLLALSAPRPPATSRRLITRCAIVLLSLFHFLQSVCECYCFCFCWRWAHRVRQRHQEGLLHGVLLCYCVVVISCNQFVCCCCFCFLLALSAPHPPATSRRPTTRFHFLQSVCTVCCCCFCFVSCVKLCYCLCFISCSQFVIYRMLLFLFRFLQCALCYCVIVFVSFLTSGENVSVFVSLLPMCVIRVVLFCFISPRFIANNHKTVSFVVCLISLVSRT